MSGSSTARSRRLLVICYVGFISLGLPDTLIGVAWPSVRATFGLQQSYVAWIFLGAGSGYFLSSFFAGRLLMRMNVGVLLAGSSALVAVSCFDYALARIWILFAAGALLHGLGSGAIDAGLNHYVANHFSARHMNWLHACYSVGAMLGPLLMTAAITQGQSWRLGYAIVGFTLLLLSLLFVSTRTSWNESGHATQQQIDDSSAGRADADRGRGISFSLALRNRFVRFHIILFFIYTGLEVAVGQWSFTVLTESRGVSPAVAGFWVSLYWGGILAGRIVFGFVADRWRIDALIRASMVTALVGVILFAWNPLPWMPPVALTLAGLGLAAIFPSLMTRTPQRLGKEMSAHAIGFQVGAAMLGAAVLPGLFGFVAQYVSLQSVTLSMAAIGLAQLAVHERLLAVDRRN